MRKLPAYMFWIPAICAVFYTGGCITQKAMESGHVCEITTPYWIYPAMTIHCEDAERTVCDTSFTYRDWAGQ